MKCFYLIILIKLLLVAIGYDNATPRLSPEKWNLRALFLVSTVLAFVALISSVLLLYLSLDSWQADNIYQE